MERWRDVETERRREGAKKRRRRELNEAGSRRKKNSLQVTSHTHTNRRVTLSNKLKAKWMTDGCLSNDCYRHSHRHSILLILLLLPIQQREKESHIATVDQLTSVHRRQRCISPGVLVC